MDEHTPGEDHSAEKLQEYLDYFCRIAVDNCKAILQHKPDLIIGLARGGITPVRATQYLWNSVMPQTCPPVLYCNIGREKLSCYTDYQLGSQNESIIPLNFYGLYSTLPEILQFLDWINKQTEWQNDLRERILGATNGRIPQTVLVFDEHRAESKTMMLALKLLNSVFLSTESYFIECIPWDWRVSMAAFWLKEFHPGVYDALIDEQRAGAFLKNHQLEDALHSIVVGVEDTEPDSIGFNYLQPTSEPIEQLKEYLPAEQWLLLPVWVEEQIIGYIDSYVSRSDAMSQILAPSQYSVTGDSIDWLLILAFVKQWGHITIHQVERLFDVDTEKAEEILDRLVAYTADEDIRFIRTKVARKVIYSFEEKAKSYELLGIPTRNRKTKKNSLPLKSRSRRKSSIGT